MRMTRVRGSSPDIYDPRGPRWLGKALVVGGMTFGFLVFLGSQQDNKDALWSSAGILAQTKMHGATTRLTSVVHQPKLVQPIAIDVTANNEPPKPYNQKISKERDFFQVAKKTGTDKVWGPRRLEDCLKDRTKCNKPDAVNPKCMTGNQGHWYHTMYNKWLGKHYSTDDAEPFQFLEVGFYNGKGFDAYKEFLPRAETHSIEIACIEAGPREEGKWPWGNFASKNPNYQHYLDTHQLHCGDGSDYDFLQKVWTTEMKRPNAPPLKVVVDDGAHLAHHMATTLFFWFPKLEPGGILVVEDIQPIQEANKFRTHILPQVMKDLHFCGDPQFKDKMCFPTIQPLLQSVHCEMHICVFERNDQPAVEYDDPKLSMPPSNAFDAASCLFNHE